MTDEVYGPVRNVADEQAEIKKSLNELRDRVNKMDESNDSLTRLRKSNQARHAEWSKGKEISIDFRAMEVGGEAGEVLNEVKKLSRERMGILGSKSSPEKLAEEIADVIISIDLLAMEFNIDLALAVQKKFDATSEKYGLKSRFITQ